tara:strand:- start:121 stop:1206 length:1086 start_codon:yes stop_codon:yes gene_type:complete
LKIKLAGLWAEKLPSGQVRYRVRVEGNPSRKIRLHVSPDHPNFMEHYRAARAGIELPPESDAVDRTVRHSLTWLVNGYLAHLTDMVKTDQASPLTLNQRESLLREMLSMKTDKGESYGDFSMQMPTSRMLSIRNGLMKTPGKSANMVKAIRGLYKWAFEAGHLETNIARDISKPRMTSKGAIAWTVDDLRNYRTTHVPGTAAHLCLTLFMFTACRISDAYRLGRGNEVLIDGEPWLAWQPKKKGSAFVEIPMLPPLLKATRRMTVIGESYLMTEYGRPYQSAEGLRNRFKKWCVDAGLGHLSSHGIRKAAGTLLAEEGCTTYEIMSIHGHSEAKTSEIYTKAASRKKLAQTAMRKLEGMEW